MMTAGVRRAGSRRAAVIAPVAELTSDRQVAAILHPVRRRVLAALVRPASAAEVARELGITAQIANYHVRALEAAGLAREVETRRKRNLLERRFRALARSFTLSSALPLSEAQRHRLQSDAALQQLVHAGDAIRADALRLLEAEPGAVGSPEEAPTVTTSHPAAAIELDVELAGESDRAAFVRAVVEAVRSAAAPFSPSRAARPRAPETERALFRVHLAVYPVVDGGTAAPGGSER